MTKLTQHEVNEPVPAYGARLPADADVDLKGSLQAIKRAAQRAREVALQTGTALIVQRAGQVVRVQPAEKAPS
jgi:hypothetical protein